MVFMYILSYGLGTGVGN